MCSLGRCLTAALAVLMLAGCAAPRPFMPPLAPATLGHSVEQRQQVTIHYKGRTRSLQVVLKIAPGDLEMIGLSAIGQRLFTLSWDGHHASLTSPIDRLGKFDPVRVLADLQLAYWPLPALRAALPAGLRLQQIGSARILWRKDQLLWFASRAGPDRWTSALTIYNARRGYRLQIQPLAAPTTPRTDTP